MNVGSNVDDTVTDDKIKWQPISISKDGTEAKLFKKDRSLGGVLRKDNAPPYSADGPYVLTGYRAELSIKECLWSMFHWHNQTINIWTSVVLFFFNLWLAAHYTAQAGDMPAAFLAFFWIQGILRAFCWFNSWSYHTFVCHNEYTAKSLCTMDYIGCYLTPLGMGSNLLFIELYCFKTYQSVLLAIGFIAIVAALAVSTMPFYQTEKYRMLRLGLSFFSSLPYLVGLALALGIAHDRAPSYYQFLLYGFMFELLGGFFYASFVPEIYFPEIFDNWLASHQIWHWLNFGFDFFMMFFAFKAFIDLRDNGTCSI